MMIQITEATRKTLKPGDIIRVALDPTVGSETQKTRPAIVLTEEQLNSASRTVVVVPLTSGSGTIMRLFPQLDSSQNDCNVHGTAILTQMRGLDPVARSAVLIGAVTDQAFIDSLRLNLAAIFGITLNLLDPA